MKDERLNEKLLRAIRSRKRRIRWQRFVSILACVSIFVTTYALILPASTMDVDEYAVCGMMHHVHTDACYAWNEVPEERTLICTLEEGEQPASEGDAYQESPDAEPLRHVHTDACYLITEAHRERGDLICTIPEHEHDMNCFVRAQEEAEYCCGYDYEHTHAEECYIDGVLVCSYTEHTHTDECRSIMDMTIESAPASDGAVAVISGLLPVGAKAEIEAVELSYEDMVRYFGEKRAASMNAYVAYDICIMVDGEEWQPDETVSVSVRQPDITVEDGEELAVAHVDSETDDISDVEEVAVDESGEVSFETDGFSLYIFYTFTVDFHYGDVTFSIAGYDDILLSELLAALELDFDMAEIEAVYFSDPFLLEVEAVDGDWLLTSLAPFDTDETLTLVFADGSMFEIWVTDAQGDDDDDGGTLPSPSPVPVTHTAIADAENSWNTDGTIKVLGSSDKPTSDIETLLQEYSQNQNGKVLTDKSVVYNGNDYVNWSYEPDEFSVTLSALAQEYYLSAEDRITAPMDLVLVLDMSASMTSNKINDQTRLQLSVNAINKLIEYVLAANPQNRIGIVTFESTANVRLPLDRYDYESVSPNTTSKIRQYLTISNTSTVKIDSSFYKYNGSQVRFSTATATNTQLGLKTAYDQCFKNATTTCQVDVKNDAGEVVRSYTVNRQPVIMLLSDGEPNRMYKNEGAIGNVFSGSGGDNSGETTDGTFGYWTVRSANYFKKQVTKKYNQQALFFTVGLGVGKPYCQAVLDPSTNNWNNLNGTTPTGNKNTWERKKQTDLRKLLATGDITTSGTYDGNYSYADDSVMDENLTDAQMSSFFAKINTLSSKLRTFGFVLDNRSSVEIVDYIGKGMEVREDQPLILRYDARNFTLTKDTANSSTGHSVYKYTGSPITVTKDVGYSVDLSAIKVVVDTDAAGLQTVTMSIPDDQLPAFSPKIDPVTGKSQNYYYEVYPARLIYKVGLTEEAKNGVAAGQTYYTNRTTEENSVVTGTAYSQFCVKDENPYYNKIEYANSELDERTNAKWWPDYLTPTTGATYGPRLQEDGCWTGTGLSAIWKKAKGTDNTTGKTNNPTQTAVDAWDYKLAVHQTRNVVQVTNTLGNNGMLTFTDNSMDITVKKEWVGGSGSEITVQLYQQTGTNAWTAVTGKTLTLNSGNEFSGSFTNLPKLTGGYKYAVVETSVPAGYTVSYSPAGSINPGSGTMNAAVVDGTGNAEITITNSASAALPSTGGSGTNLFVIIGAALVAGSLTGGYAIYRKREGRES